MLWVHILWVLIRIALSRGDSNEYPQHMFFVEAFLIFCRGDSNEYPQHMFLWRSDENYPLIITKYPPYLFH